MGCWAGWLLPSLPFLTAGCHPGCPSIRNDPFPEQFSPQTGPTVGAQLQHGGMRAGSERGACGVQPCGALPLAGVSSQPLVQPGIARVFVLG